MKPVSMVSKHLKPQLVEFTCDIYIYIYYILHRNNACRNVVESKLMRVLQDALFRSLPRRPSSAASSVRGSPGQSHS